MLRNTLESQIADITQLLFRSASQENGGDKRSPDTKIFDPEAVDFISVLSSRTGKNEPTSAFEVARFRLIAASLRLSGNDELYLGNHDANLMFRHRNEMSFSSQEMRALANCGIVAFTHQNVPLWRWLIASGNKSDPFSRLKILAIIGNTDEQINAIKLLQLIDETVPELDTLISKEIVLRDYWLGPEQSSQTFDAAIQFLITNGTPEDIEIIDQISADTLSDKKAQLDGMVASIKTRYSHEEALRFICAKNVEKMPESVVDAIFSTPSALPTDVLALCLSVKSDGVRLKALKLLIERSELSGSAAQDLMSDSSYEIRLLVVEYLQVGKNPLPDEIVKTVLTIRRNSRGLKFFLSAEADTTYYDRFVRNRLQELDFDQLKERVRKAGVFNDKELFAFYGKFGKRLCDDIRANLCDHFVTVFDESVQRVEAIPGMAEGYRTEVKPLWSFYQKALCSGALAALCRLMLKTDIGLVRATVDAVEIEASSELLVYFAKFGDWSDVGRIERLSSVWNGRSGLPQTSYNTYVDKKASAIFELGKNRIADLLIAELSAPIRKAVTKLFPKSVFTNLSNEAIIKELNREDDEYRIIFSLRCVDSLPKERIETILDLYIEHDGQRYYNSIHWLDLGASLSRKQATSIARRELVRRSL